MIAELCRAGEILCRYEVEKKQAISREDYDTASEKKVGIKAVVSSSLDMVQQIALQLSYC